MAMLSFERKYRVRGGTLLGGDLFDFWVGPFYVGFFGVTTIFFSFVGIALIMWGAARSGRPGTLADQHRAAGHQLRAGSGAAEGRRSLAAHHRLRARRIRLVGAARGRDLPQARHRPARALRLQRRDLRLLHARRDPAGAAGRLGHGFPYGIISHLDWVSNTGYQYLHFHYNPAHMIAVTFFFTTTLALALHGSLVLSAVNPARGETVKTPGTREHLLPRHDRLFDRHARHPPPRPVPGPLGGLLERRLHHHQRPLLDPWLARMVDLVARSPDLALRRGHRHGRISEHLHPRSNPWPRLRGRAASPRPLRTKRLVLRPPVRPSRRCPGRADLSRLDRPCVAALRLHRHRDHRPQHAGLGELGPDPVRPQLPGWRSSRPAPNGDSRSCRRSTRAAGG
jgi:photosynthetic reaction center L subunit